MLTFAVVILAMNPSALVAHSSWDSQLTSHGPGKYLASLGVSISPNGGVEADAGQTLTFVLNATGGSGTYVSYEFFVNGSLVQSSSSNLLNYQFKSAANYTVNGSVTDSMGNHASSPVVSVAVHPPLRALISLKSDFIDMGDSEVAYASALNGSPPYNISFTGCPLVPANHSRCWINGTAVGTVYFNLSVVDQTGSRYTLPGSVAIMPSPRTWLNATFNNTAVNTTDSLTASRSGGLNGIAGWYYFAWSGCPAGEVKGAWNDTCSFNVSVPGVYRVTEWYNDSWNTSTASVDVTVMGPMRVVISSEYPVIDVGVTERIQATLLGGVGPYSYEWKGGCIPWNAPTCNFTGAAPGTSNLTLTVTDSQGQQVLDDFPVKVSSPPSLSLLLPVAVDANKSAIVEFQTGGGTGTLRVTPPTGCTRLNATSCLWTAPGAVGGSTLIGQVTDNFLTENGTGSTTVVWGPQVHWLSGKNHLDVGMETQLRTWLGFYPQPAAAGYVFDLNGSSIQT